MTKEFLTGGLELTKKPWLWGQGFNFDKPNEDNQGSIYLNSRQTLPLLILSVNNPYASCVAFVQSIDLVVCSIWGI